MGLIGSLVTFSAGQVIKSADVNGNFTEIKTKVNGFCLFTDVDRTVTAVLTLTAAALLFGASTDVGSAAAPPRDGYFSRNLLVGAPASTAGSAAGDAILKNAAAIRSANAAGSTTQPLITLDVNNYTRVGNTAGPIIFGSTFIIGTGAAAGDLVIGTSSYLRAMINGGGSLRSLIGLDVNNDLRLGGDANVKVLVGFGGGAGTSNGEIALANAKSYRANNAAGTTSKALVGLDVSDRVVLSGDGQDIMLGRALIALGGGAAPTFGTIGGSGPATAAQNTWAKFIDSTGAAMYVPVWK